MLLTYSHNLQILKWRQLGSKKKLFSKNAVKETVCFDRLAKKRQLNYFQVSTFFGEISTWNQYLP